MDTPSLDALVFIRFKWALQRPISVIGGVKRPTLLADIDTDSSRSVKQCYNTRIAMRLSCIVRSNRCHRKTVASPLSWSKACDLDRITIYFTSSKRLPALDVRGGDSSSSLPTRRGFRPPRIALPTPLSLSRSPIDALRLIIGDYTVIDNTANSHSEAHEG
eukprot:Gb_27678 [translate_table: standard]